MVENKMGKNIYEETISAKWMTVSFAVITIIFFSVFLYQLLTGPIGADPAPDVLWLVLALLFFSLTLNFRKLKINISSEGISAGYGIFKSTISWEKLEEVYLDETSTARYGGWGIRVSRVEGNWRLVYNVIGGPRVVISSKDGFFKDLAFSTKNPEEVIEIIEDNRN